VGIIVSPEMVDRRNCWPHTWPATIQRVCRVRGVARWRRARLID